MFRKGHIRKLWTLLLVQSCVLSFEQSWTQWTTRQHGMQQSLQVPVCSLLLPTSLFFLPLCHPSTSHLFHPPAYFPSLSPLLYPSPPFLQWQHCTFMFTFLHLLLTISSFMSLPHLLRTSTPSLLPFPFSRPRACPLICSLSCHLKGWCCYGNTGRTCLHSNMRK